MAPNDFHHGLLGPSEVRTDRIEDQTPVFLQGAPVDALHVLESGCVQVILVRGATGPVTDSDLRERGEIVALIDSPGVVIAELTPSLDERAASAVSIGPVRLKTAPVSGDSLRAGLSRRPELALTVARGLAVRLCETYHGLHLIGQVHDRIQDDLDRHCLAYRTAVEDLRRPARTSLDLRNFMNDARRAFSFRLSENDGARDGSAAGPRRSPPRARPGSVQVLAPGQSLPIPHERGGQILLLEQGRLDLMVAGRITSRLEAGHVVAGETALASAPPDLVELCASEESRLSTLGDAESALRAQPDLLPALIRSLAQRTGEAGAMLCSLRARARDLLDALDGPGPSCRQDLERLADGAAPHAEAVGATWLDGVRDRAVAVVHDFTARESELKRIDRMTERGVAFRRIRGHVRFQELAGLLDSLLKRLCMAATTAPSSFGPPGTDAGEPVTREDFEALARAIIENATLLTPAHLEPDRQSDLVAHSLGVAVWAVAIAGPMKLGAVRRDLVLGCLLHDVGAIRRDGEHGYDAKRHTTDYADQWLWPLGDLPAAAVHVIRQHHESAAGEGYPNGLRGDEIDPAARVAALANYADLLAAQGYSLDEIAAGARDHGAHFDPAALDALEAAIETFKAGPAAAVPLDELRWLGAQ